MTCLLAANMACSSSEESSVERPVCSCAEVCFDNLSRGLVCFIIPICNRNITCLVRNLFPGFIPAFLRRYPWLYNIESRFTQMQEEYNIRCITHYNSYWSNSYFGPTTVTRARARVSNLIGFLTETSITHVWCLTTQRLQAKSELKTRSPPPGISIHVKMSFRQLTLTMHTRRTRWLSPDHIVKKLIPECNAHNIQFHPACNSTG